MIDANVILRYILRDNEEQAEQANKIIQNGAYSTMAIIAEVIYVLENVYLVPRNRIKQAIVSLLEDIGCQDSEIITYGMNVYETVKLDFIDCMLVGFHKVKNIDVFSFDKKLNKTMKMFEL